MGDADLDPYRFIKRPRKPFLRLNWPWFNGPLMRFSPSMATLQLLGGDSETKRALRELNTLPSNTTEWPWPGLEIKMSLFHVQRACHGGIPHRRRERLIKNRKKSVILEPKPN